MRHEQQAPRPAAKAGESSNKETTVASLAESGKTADIAKTETVVNAPLDRVGAGNDLRRHRPVTGTTKAGQGNLGDAVAYNNRGTAKARKGDLDGAIGDFDKAIDLAPKLAGTYHNRGTAKKDSGDLDGAIMDYTKAIELDPTFSLAFHSRGDVRRKMGHWPAALADYTRAIELKPHFVEDGVAMTMEVEDDGQSVTVVGEVQRVIPLTPPSTQQPLPPPQEGQEEQQI